MADLNEARLERRLLVRSIGETQVVEADFAHAHIELRRKGVMLMLMRVWGDCRAAHEGRCTRFPPVLRALQGFCEALDASAPASR